MPKHPFRLLGGAAAIAAAVGLPAPAATPPVGETTKVVRDVRGVLSQQERQLELRDTVYFNEVIESGTDSATQITFADDTRLRMGPQSRLTLNRVVYDPDTNTGDFVVKATKGVFEFTTGKLTPDRYKFETPTGTIGVRGTQFTLIVLDDENPQLIQQAQGDFAENAVISARGGRLQDGVLIYLNEGGPLETVDCSGNQTTMNVASPIDVTFQGSTADGRPMEPLSVRLLDNAVLTGAASGDGTNARTLDVRLPEGVTAADIARLEVVSARDGKTQRQVSLRTADGSDLAYSFANGALTAYRAGTGGPSPDSRVFQLRLNEDSRTATLRLEQPLAYPQNEQTVAMVRDGDGCDTEVIDGKLTSVQTGETQVAALLDAPVEGPPPQEGPTPFGPPPQANPAFPENPAIDARNDPPPSPPAASPAQP